jgi:hypothetical protein
MGFMSNVYNIEVPFTEQELQEILHEDKSFSWVFNTSEDDNVCVNVNIFKEE